MITESFERSEPIISPGSFYGAQKHLVDTCVATFSRVLFEQAIAEFSCEKIAEIGSCNGMMPIYGLDLGGRRIGIYLSPLGAALAGTTVIEANWLTGATKFVLFGSAGCLNRQATEGKYVVPTEAYRDEGMSYHYAPPTDYIAVKGAEKVSSVFASLGVPHVCGRVWTTDAMYRETRAQVDRRMQDGCLAVEMELAGVQAVCDFHGFELYDFLMTGDVLDAPEYSVGDLGRANHLSDNLRLALKLAESL